MLVDTITYFKSNTNIEKQMNLSGEMKELEKIVYLCCASLTCVSGSCMTFWKLIPMNILCHKMTPKRDISYFKRAKCCGKYFDLRINVVDIPLIGKTLQI